MRVKRKGEVIEIDKSEMIDGDEEVTDTPEATPEAKPEATPDETKAIEDKALEKVAEAIGDKMVEAVKDIKDHPTKESEVFKEEVTNEKSVMETEPYLRSKRPFVKLSPTMEKFIERTRAVAKGDIAGIVKALGESNDETGGFLVPDEFQAEIVRYLDEASVVRPGARVFNMTRDNLTLPTLVQSSSVFGGMSVVAVAESTEGTDSQPVFGRLTLEANKIMGIVPTSNELLDDSAVNLANFLVVVFGEAMADFEDSKFLTGNGINVPLGIVETTGINLVSREASTSITFTDIINMWKGTLSTFDRNAVWITNKAGLAQLMQIDRDNSSGVLMFLPSLRDAIPATVLGKPVLVTERVKSLGTKGDILYGDLKHYFIGDRGGIQVDSSIHERFRFDETLIRMIKRVDGQLSIAKAFTALRE